MRPSQHPQALRVQAALGDGYTVVEFDESTHTSQQAAPEVRARASFNADLARRQRAKEPFHLLAPQPLSAHHSASNISTMNLKNRLRDIEANQGYVIHHVNLLQYQ